MHMHLINLVKTPMTVYSETADQLDLKEQLQFYLKLYSIKQKTDKAAQFINNLDSLEGETIAIIVDKAIQRQKNTSTKKPSTSRI